MIRVTGVDRHVAGVDSDRPGVDRRMKWLVLAVVLSGCWPAAQCKVTTIDIYPLGNKPKPAGKVVVGCDGKKLVEVESDEVK